MVPTTAAPENESLAHANSIANTTMEVASHVVSPASLVVSKQTIWAFDCVLQEFEDLGVIIME
jgi:hypothetical protein